VAGCSTGWAFATRGQHRGFSILRARLDRCPSGITRLVATRSVEAVTERRDVMTLDGRVAIVTGASRGIGKGIATELGAAGATVVVTGRSTSRGSHRLGGTVQETADLATEAGGVGVARYVDHADDAQVRDLVAGVIDEFGRIDLLVNNVFSTPEPTTPDDKIFGPFWLTPIWAWDAMQEVPD
jgi:NAD(P)-dependent dehydrogenase (short-subunit alcohol dehydrogenase family)